MKSIKTRLIVYFSILILLSTTIIGGVALLYSSKSLRQEAEKSLISLSKEAARITESRIETQMRTLGTVAGIRDITSMDMGLAMEVLKNQVARTNFIDLGVVFPNGKAYFSDGSTSDLGDREYVKSAFKGETVVSDVMVSKLTGELVMMYATPIIRNSDIVGVLVGRRDGEALSNIVDDIGYGENGYGYVINNRGIVVGHPNRTLVSDEFDPIELAKQDKNQESLARLFKRILVENQGVSEYNFNGNNLYAGYAPVNGTDWILVITANSDEVLSAVKTMRNSILIILLVMIIIGMAFTYIIGSSIAIPVLESVKFSQVIADLDLRVDIPEIYVNRPDGIGQLAKGFKHLTNSLRDILFKINSLNNP